MKSDFISCAWPKKKLLAIFFRFTKTNIKDTMNAKINIEIKVSSAIYPFYKPQI